MSDKAENRKANISINPKIREWGERLAKEDHRDFSNEVEWLIEQEWKRRNMNGHPVPETTAVA